MLRYGARCGFDPSWAESALSYAAKTGDTLAISPFLGDFDINHRINGNETALMLASRNGRFDTVMKLIHAGAGIRIPNQDGFDSQQIAESSGHYAIAALLELYESPSWKEIPPIVLQIRGLIRASQVASYETLLETPKFGQLLKLRMDCELETGEIIWFRATDRCSIGIDSSNSLIWMFDGARALHDW